MGLVDAVVQQEMMQQKAREIVSRLMSRGFVASQDMKILVNAADGEEVKRLFE